MGILHLAGLGRSPGAVTCGLSFLQHRYGVRHPELGQIVDEVIVFTSHELADRKLATPAAVCLNRYGQDRCVDKEWSAAPVMDILTHAFEELFPSAVLHVCPVDLNDFYDCLRAVAQTLHRFHPRGKTGRHVQVNLTGGTNVLNSALFLGSKLSGVVAKFYYTFVHPEHLKYLQPVTEESAERFRYQEIPLLTTGARIDESLHYLLLALAELPPQTGWLDEDELWSRLAPVLREAGVDRDSFRRDYLNVLDGQFLRRPGSRSEGGQDTRTAQVQLTDEGRALLRVLDAPWFRALHRDPQAPGWSAEELTQGLGLKRIRP